MAERESGGASSWVAFLAGVILVAVVGFGVVAYTGGMERRETAELEFNLPDVKVNPPDINLPAPAPSMPPTAEPAPADAPAP